MDRAPGQGPGGKAPEVESLSALGRRTKAANLLNLIGILSKSLTGHGICDVCCYASGVLAPMLQICSFH